jgi:hypothetical protein
MQYEKKIEKIKKILFILRIQITYTELYRLVWVEQV